METKLLPIMEKTFVVVNSICDIDEFRELSKLASRLKQYGRVQVDISALADKSWYEIPEGGSPWHEYAHYNPTLFKFFPHPKIAPYLPADWVSKNRELLLAKAKILHQLKLEAHFYSWEPTFMPESFFEEYPHLRGARIDHPRRSRKEAFAWCVDLPETLEMIEWMMAQLKQNVPELASFKFETNDAGAGLCWSENLYIGPNGPQHCRNRGVGLRMEGLLKAIHRGAEKGGGAINVYVKSMHITENERREIRLHLPPNTCFYGNDDSSMSVGVGSSLALGLFDPISLVDSMERIDGPQTRTVFVSFPLCYRGGHKQTMIPTLEKIIDIVEDCIAEPAHGLMERMRKVRGLCEQWGEKENTDNLLEAFFATHDSFRLISILAPYIGPVFAPIYCGVTMRYFTRPLVIKPELLSAEEEAYFLPYIFNIHESEARTDYVDLHGARIMCKGVTLGTGGARIKAVSNALHRVIDAAKTLENVNEVPAGNWLCGIAISWRIEASIIRSCNNFCGAQTIRDRNKEILAGEPRIPSKEPTSTGDLDFRLWNEIQRDEFDNVNELISLLENGGLDLLYRAKDTEHEDMFVLGPDIIGALKKKAKIMRDHWLDVEKYLTTPLI